MKLSLLSWIRRGLLLTVLASAVAVVGCNSGGKRLGAAIPADAVEEKLSTVLANPGDYNGKTVLLKGVVSGQCASLCEFFFKDGVHTATVFPQGYKLPKLETGKRVSVLAQVTAGAENVVLSAVGLQME